MIAFARHPKRGNSTWHAGFLAMLPGITKFVRHAFRRLDAESREEAVQEALANCVVAYHRLWQQRRLDLAYPTVLARYAVAQVRAGRRVGRRRSSQDVLSEYAQRKHGLAVDRLDHYDPQEEGWREIVVQDRRATPAELAIVRIDFAAWLLQLTARKRRIARVLATGETTLRAARRFHVSPARISQLRRELQEHWQTFQGERDAFAARELSSRGGPS